MLNVAERSPTIEGFLYSEALRLRSQPNILFSLSEQTESLLTSISLWQLYFWKKLFITHWACVPVGISQEVEKKSVAFSCLALVLALIIYVLLEKSVNSLGLHVLTFIFI